nr:Cyclin A1,1 isoform 2 [Ipomoea batatas]GMC60894.1 Cyclin A1,1 isoform 2 [Ipomoea batatas]
MTCFVILLHLLLLQQFFWQDTYLLLLRNLGTLRCGITLSISHLICVTVLWHSRIFAATATILVYRQSEKNTASISINLSRRSFALHQYLLSSFKT